MELNLLYEIQNLQTDWLDWFMILVTRLGDKGFLWMVIAICFLLFRKTRNCGILMIVSMALCFLFGNLVLKNLFARERPFMYAPEIILKISAPKDYSFPSGHTMNSFSAASVIYFHYKKIGMIAMGMAMLIAFSRMYLFVHFPTDILGGILVGSGIAFYTVKMTRKRVI